MKSKILMIGVSLGQFKPHYTFELASLSNISLFSLLLYSIKPWQLNV